jgi:translocator protein
MTKKSKWLALLVFVLIIFLLESAGSFFTQTSVRSWYPALNKPSWTPPDWAFAIWSVLYLMIAVSGWLVFCQPSSKKKRRALWIYSAQLFLNLIWSFLFFYLRSPLLGCIDILLLFASIIWVIVRFWPLSRIASLLLIPYLIWTAFACILNINIWLLNI